MQTGDKAITFRVDADLKSDFEAAAAAEHRSVTGALTYLMERRVAEHKAQMDRESSSSKAAA